MTVGDGVVPRPAIVVGVDGSERNEAAIAYAVAEAVGSGRPVLLVAAVEDAGPTVDGIGSIADHYEAMLAELRARIEAEHDGLTVRTEVRFGHPVGTLMASTGDEDVLVVGKRGLGPVRRILIGSTSIRAAGWSRVPLIVVPGGWDVAEHAAAPVVVGIDPERDDDHALRFGFERAERSGVPLRVVYAVDMELVLVVGAGAVVSSDVHDWEVRSVAAIEEALKPLREEFPDVAVEIVHERSHAATVLAERSRDAQLMVVSRRRHRGPASWGLGKVAREVLHESELPVAVVPGGERV